MVWYNIQHVVRLCNKYIIQNTDFVNNSKRYPITPSFMYIHQLKKYSVYLAILQRIQDILNLTPAEQSKHIVVIDGKVLIIKAWHIVFLHMHHLQCHIHFIKNVINKMKYKMKAVTKYQQRKSCYYFMKIRQLVD